MGFENLKVGQVSEGFWGAHTSTIDWCENNYEVTKYVAEFVNTISNIPFIALGLYGWYKCNKHGLPKRYGILMLGLCLIGVGSFGFHMTLKWAWQLLDELPMIYVITYCALMVFDTKPGFNMRWGRAGVVVMLAFDLFVTVSYMTLPNPIYHQISFATIQLLSVVRLVHIIRTQTPPQSEARSTVYRLLGTGVASFAGAFGVWNLDNVFCETWRAAREKISPFGFLLEGHAIWHFGTGMGAYLIIVGAIYLCLMVKTDINAWQVKWDWIFPYVAPRIALAAKEPVAKTSQPESESSKQTQILEKPASSS